MGESIGGARLQFNGSLHVESREERLSGEGGAVFLREVDERLGLVKSLAGRLQDPRNPEKITHPLEELLRTVLLLECQGWQDQDDADALRHDPVLRLAVSMRRGIAPLQAPPPVEDPFSPRTPDGLASQPTLSRLLWTLASDTNLPVLREALLDWSTRRVLAARGGHRLRHLTIDLDSLPIEVHGEQPQARHNPHYGDNRVYHPLVASSAALGDILDVELRAGNVHTADGALAFILQLLDRVEGKLCEKASLRVDAGFPSEKFLGPIEERKTKYVARVRNNAVLDRMAVPFLTHPPGRPPEEKVREWYYEQTYQAGEWLRARRVVLVVTERPGQLWLDHFWLITNWTESEKDGATLAALYRERGTAEGYQGEWKDVLDPRLSSINRMKDHYRGEEIQTQYRPGRPFAQNHALLVLDALAYNLLHVARTLMEASTHQGWSLRRLRERVLRVATRVLVHANQAVIVVGQAAARAWDSLWKALARLRPVPA